MAFNVLGTNRDEFPSVGDTANLNGQDLYDSIPGVEPYDPSRPLSRQEIAALQKLVLFTNELDNFEFGDIL